MNQKSSNFNKEKKQLIEDLAELEHKQWIKWSKNLVKNENISKDRVENWKKLWIPYKNLTKKQKEKDRIWAKKVLKIKLKSVKLI